MMMIVVVSTFGVFGPSGCVGDSRSRLCHRDVHHDRYGTGRRPGSRVGVVATRPDVDHSRGNESDVGTGAAVAAADWAESGCRHHDHVMRHQLEQPNCLPESGAGMTGLHWQHFAWSTVAGRWSIDREECLERPRVATAGAELEHPVLLEQGSAAPQQQEFVVEGEKQQADSAVHWRDSDFARHYSILRTELPAGLQPAQWRQKGLGLRNWNWSSGGFHCAWLIDYSN